MKITDYLDSLSPKERSEFAERASTSLAYLSQLANGHRKAGLKTVHAIEVASNGVVTGSDLRPDVYGGHSDE
jgi:DNA-binding transcriptional regulator YdaS (Cro superfamily)